MKSPTEFIEFVIKSSRLINHYIEHQNYTQACFCLGQLNSESEKMLEEVTHVKKSLGLGQKEEKENPLDELLKNLSKSLEK